MPEHWEGGLIIGADSGSAIGSLLEPTTRFTMLLHLPAAHGAAAARDAITTTTTLPAELRRSLTWDQGIELSEHARLSIEADLPVFFCDPHSPWQRGTNENTVQRPAAQYFPKGTDLSVRTAEHMAEVAAALNGRPGKTLEWKSPSPRYYQQLQYETAGVATTG